MKNSDPRPNNAEAERIHRMMKLGCICCALLDQPNLWHLECHHILDGNRRLGHWWTLPLCRGHHQGEWSERQRLTIPDEKRVAISSGRKVFNRAYRPELELWQLQQQRLQLDETLPVLKCTRRNREDPCIPMIAVRTSSSTDW